MYYEIFDFGGQKNIIFKVDTSYMKQRICKQDSIVSPPPQLVDKLRNIKNSNTNIQYRGGSSCDVRVLVLYTDAAEQVGNPGDAAYLAIDESNQIFENSDVNMTFSLAGVKKLEGFTESSDMFITRNLLFLNDDAKSLRDEYQADMVVLYTDCNSPDYWGLSFLNHWGDPEYAYVVVDIDANSKRYTFTHELTHDFGCKHFGDNRGAPDFIKWAQGWSWRKGFLLWKKWHGTIHDTYDESTRHMNVSNPTVLDGKHATGTQYNNNALQLNNMACIVSDYRDYIPPMRVTISGPSKGNNSETYTWCIHVTGCDDISEIEWEYSYDGFNFYPLQSGGDCFTGHLPNGEDLILRVKVKCSDGQTSEDSHLTLNLDKKRCFKALEVATNTENIDIEKKSIKISPNPVHNSLNLDYFVNNAGAINIEIIDVFGKKVINLRKNYNVAGNYSESIDLNQLKRGFYTVRLILPSGASETKSIIKQ